MGEKIFSAAILLFGVIFLVEGLNYQDAQHLYATSATFPVFVSILLIISSTILLIKQFYVEYKLQNKIPNKITVKTMVTIAAIILFYLVLPYLGFLIAGTLLTIVFALMIQVNEKKVFDTFVFPIIIVTIIFFFFSILGIYLPAGVLF
ncbi:hypothetical protein BBEV_2186 [Salisediminibacterium beveridgei]|uniref:DUF1468 domain-containing protein n=1 Tax=Salisediminibacterium beveridgei TaxID=632773 RepID=A0A1D7QX07_9BACI|nr:hypothetical protein BBEV_2186 [Salisediminibacterium beveridgei]